MPHSTSISWKTGWSLVVGRARQSAVTVDEVLEEVDPGVHTGDTGLTAALAPRNESDHVPTSRGAFANKGSATIAIAGIFTVATGTNFGSVRFFCKSVKDT